MRGVWGVRPPNLLFRQKCWGFSLYFDVYMGRGSIKKFVKYAVGTRPDLFKKAVVAYLRDTYLVSGVRYRNYRVRYRNYRLGLSLSLMDRISLKSPVSAAPYPTPL